MWEIRAMIHETLQSKLKMELSREYRKLTDEFSGKEIFVVVGNQRASEKLSG